MKHGRPKKIDSDNLEKQFQKLYSRGIRAETAAELLNTDRKTAYKYYKKFSDAFSIITVKNLFTDGLNRVKQQLASYDNLLLELYDSLDIVNEQIDKKREDGIPQNLLHQKISLVREINKITQEKLSVDLDIPINESVDELVEEVVSKHARI